MGRSEKSSKMHRSYQPLTPATNRLLSITRKNRVLMSKISFIRHVKAISGEVPRCKSLNQRKKVSELVQVEKENKVLMNRIKSISSRLADLESEEEWRLKQQYVNNRRRKTNITRYPKYSQHDKRWCNSTQRHNSSGYGIRNSYSDVGNNVRYKDTFSDVLNTIY